MLADNEIKNFPELIYRYRSDVDYNYQSLLHNYLYAATPNALNDPLDCCITYNLDFIYKKLVKLEKFINNYALEIFPTKETKKVDEFSSCEEYETFYNQTHLDAIKKLSDISNKEIVKNFINKKALYLISLIRNCFGVISFSLLDGSPLLWSHYASNYKGFVLGFDFKTFNSIVNNYLLNDFVAEKNLELYGFHFVNYVHLNEIPDGTKLMYSLLLKSLNKNFDENNLLNYFKTYDEKRLLLSLITTKSKSWEYEKEVRLILPHSIFNDFNFRDFKNELPKFFKASDCYIPNQLIIGDKMNETNKAIIGYYCFLNNSVQLFQINTSRLMHEKTLYKVLIKPQDVLKEIPDKIE